MIWSSKILVIALLSKWTSKIFCSFTLNASKATKIIQIGFWMSKICSFEVKGVCRNPSLGLATKARGCKVAGQVGDPGALHMLPGVQRVWGNEPSHSQVNSHVRSWSPERTPESLERDCRGQNSLPRRFIYIIEKLLKCRCRKWARMAHLDIWNTSYGQKKGRESNCQFDSRPLKVANRPDLLGCRWRITYRWKALDKIYNFASDCTSIRGLLTKLWDSKVPEVPVGEISGLPPGSPGREKQFGCRPRGEAHSIL
jgi:hypothetical protein